MKLMYLPPYSPDLKPIEEFFAELEALIIGMGCAMKITLNRAFIIS
jgi:hypothetical protein